MDMGESECYFYRCFSDRSAGGLISGRGSGDRRLSVTDLYSEFKNHSQKDSEAPTALVSASNRIVDTLQRAFNKFYKHEESPHEIWVAFIYVPDSERDVYHHAEKLAQCTNKHDNECFRYEYLFEWEIPQRYLIHRVSIATLMDRGYDMGRYLEANELPSTWKLCAKISKSILDPCNTAYDVGLNLGHLSRYFGARAPIRQIAHQMLQDFSSVLFNDDGLHILRVICTGRRFDRQECQDIEEGISTALYDWWLADPDFLDSHEEYLAYVLQLEEEMERRRECLHDAVIDMLYDDYTNIMIHEDYVRRIQTEQDKFDRDIEKAATILGL
jgi:hypothetical protein